MAKPAPTYDLMLLLDPKLEPDARTKILDDAQAAIKKAGDVVSSFEYGNRPMTFPIRKSAEAEYDLIQFQGSPELLAQLDRTLRITDGVLRFRIIKLAPGTPKAPDLKAKAAPAPTPESEPIERDYESAPAA